MTLRNLWAQRALDKPAKATEETDPLDAVYERLGFIDGTWVERLAWNMECQRAELLSMALERVYVLTLDRHRETADGWIEHATQAVTLRRNALRYRVVTYAHPWNWIKAKRMMVHRPGFYVFADRDAIQAMSPLYSNIVFVEPL